MPPGIQQKIDINTALNIGKLIDSFEKLEKDMNFFIDPGIWCCYTCATSNANNEGNGKSFVYWHEQNEDEAYDSKEMILTYGISNDKRKKDDKNRFNDWTDVGGKINKILIDDGFKTIWGGDADSAIVVKLDIELNNPKKSQVLVLGLKIKVNEKTRLRYQHLIVESDKEFVYIYFDMVDGESVQNVVSRSFIDENDISEYLILYGQDSKNLKSNNDWFTYGGGLHTSSDLLYENFENQVLGEYNKLCDIGFGLIDENAESSFQFFSEAILINPNLGNAYYGRAICNLNQGKEYEAINDLNQVLKITPDNLEALSIRADLFLEINEPQKAINDFNSILSLEPNNYEAIYLRGLTFENLEKYQKAISDFETLLKIDPKNIKYLSGKLRSLYEIEEYEQTYEIANLIINLDQSHSEALIYRSRSNSELEQNPKEIISDCNKVLDINSSKNDCFMAKLLLPIALSKIGQFDESIRQIKNLVNKNELIEKSIMEALSFSIYGLVYLEMKEYEKVIEYCDKFFELNLLESDQNLYAETFLLRGKAKKALSNFEAAKEDFKKSADLGNEEAAKLLK